MSGCTNTPTQNNPASPQPPDLKAEWWNSFCVLGWLCRLRTSKYEYQRLHIQEGLELRYRLLESATERLAKSIAKGTASIEASDQKAERLAIPSLCIWQLAVVDVFVEKAQHFLTERSDKQERSGVWASLATLLMMAFAFFFAFVYVFNLPFSLQQTEKSDGSTIITIINFLEFLAVLGPIIGIAYFFTSLARAFFHEATILRNRRHSVRLGRLLLHLKVSSATSPEELTAVIKELDITEVERSFGWNLETSTAFKDINPEAMTTSLIAQLTAAVQKLSDDGNRTS
jgi:hypothetical protein